MPAPAAGDVGLEVVADDGGLRGRDAERRERPREELGRGLPGELRRPAGRVLESGGEGADVEGQTIRRAPVAVARQRDELGAAEDVAEGAVQARERELVAEVAKHDGLRRLVVERDALEVLAAGTRAAGGCSARCRVAAGPRARREEP